MVESKRGFLEVQIEGSFGQAFELGYPSLCIAPEVFDAVDVTFARGKLNGPVVDSEMLVKADVNMTIVTVPAVRMNDQPRIRITPCRAAFVQSGTISEYNMP